MQSNHNELYPSPGWVWQYPKPKLGTGNAGSLILSMVEFIHY